MKAKHLIELLQTIDPNAEVVTPGFDEYGAANNFTLKQVKILLNIRDATPHFAPHDYTDAAGPDDVTGYLLNGTW